MNFEIAPYAHWLFNKQLNEAQLYCLFLEANNKKGWRLPTDNEASFLARECDNSITEGKLDDFRKYWCDSTTFGFWTVEDEGDGNTLWDVIPVRDI